MSNIPILRDPTGKPIPLGRVIRTRTADFSDGVLPSWLRTTAVGAGSASFGSMTTTPGYVQLTTGAVTNDSMSLETTFEVNTGQFDEIILQAEGLNFDAATAFNVTLSLANSGATGWGSELRHQSSDSLVVIRTLKSTGFNDEIVRYRMMTGDEQFKKRNVGFWLRPKKKTAYVIEDDQVNGWVDVAALMDNGVVRPKVYIITKHAVAHWLRLSQFKLTLIHN